MKKGLSIRPTPDAEGSEVYRKRATFLFLDLRSSTEMFDTIEPEIISDVMAEIYTLIDRIVTGHGGVINKYLGDGIFVIFGDPKADKHHRETAINAALEMRERLIAVGQRLSYLPELRFGIGIHAGKATFGNFGTHQHSHYTAIGASVNLAARLQELSGTNEIISTTETYETFRDSLIIVGEKSTKVRGFQKPISVGQIVRRKTE